MAIVELQKSYLSGFFNNIIMWITGNSPRNYLASVDKRVYVYSVNCFAVNCPATTHIIYLPKYIYCQQNCRGMLIKKQNYICHICRYVTLCTQIQFEKLK